MREKYLRRVGLAQQLRRVGMMFRCVSESAPEMINGCGVFICFPVGLSVDETSVAQLLNVTRESASGKTGQGLELW